MASSGATTAVEAVSSGRLGERVKELRRARGLTLDGLADLSGVSRAMISKLERGEKNPTLVVAAKLAEGLGVTLSRLAGMEERREVVIVPKERRMIMRDPETGFERQLLSPNSIGLGVEFIRNKIPEGLHFRRIPPAPQGRRGADSSRARNLEGDTSRRGIPAKEGRRPILRGRRTAPLR